LGHDRVRLELESTHVEVHPTSEDETEETP